MEFHLYRIKLFPGAQPSLFQEPGFRPHALSAIIRSRPSIAIGKTQTWHIGNVEEIDVSSLYFRVGRTTKSTFELYRNGEFENNEFDSSPYTHVLIDLDLQVCAIAKRPKLSQTTLTVAKRLERLIQDAEYLRALDAKVEIDAIRDPEEFLNQLQNAKRVTRFWYAIERPNLIDAEELLIKPQQHAAEHLHAQRGRSEFSGVPLDQNNIVEAARSIAAAGLSAGATIDRDQELAVKKVLGRNNVSVTITQDIEQHNTQITLIVRVRQKYHDIRNGQRDNEDGE